MKCEPRTGPLLCPKPLRKTAPPRLIFGIRVRCRAVSGRHFIHVVGGISRLPELCLRSAGVEPPTQTFPTHDTQHSPGTRSSWIAKDA